MNTRDAGIWVVLGVIGGVVIGAAGCTEQAGPTPESAAVVKSSSAASSEGEASLLSAFFGLDNALSERADRFCPDASGRDGMPVVLSHTVDEDSLQPGDFQVITRSGTVYVPYCVTLRPAADPGENRTVLLIGDFGDAGDNPPVTVAVAGDLYSDSEPAVNFNGLRVPVIPLPEGPSIALAKIIPVSHLPAESRGTRCPDGVAQVVRVTWTGGVRLPDGSELSEVERRHYQVEVARKDGSRETIVPAAVADLDDRDNNHLLCLETADPAVSVFFPGGYLVDPNKDLNPDTRSAVDSE